MSMSKLAAVFTHTFKILFHVCHQQMSSIWEQQPPRVKSGRRVEDEEEGNMKKKSVFLLSHPDTQPISGN